MRQRRAHMALRFSNAAAVEPGGGTTGRVSFLDLDFDTLSLGETELWLAARAPDSAFAYLVTPNVDHIVRLADAAPLVRRAYARADLCLCDSRVLARLARLAGVTLSVVPGSDVVAGLFDRVVAPGDRICLIGGSVEDAAKLGALRPAINLLHHAPPMGLRENEVALNVAVTFAQTAEARFTLLAVGSPQQELLALKMRESGMGHGTALCIGASIDFLIGKQSRAPRIVRRAGIEWAWRLLTQPRRLAKRYLIDGPAIFSDGLALATGRAGTQAVTETARRVRIVHLAIDFNTTQRKPTTTAIEWLVEDLTEFDNVVVALERSTRRTFAAPVAESAKAGRIYHFPFHGLPFGLGLHRAMRRAAARAIAVLEQDGIRPDLVHAHKLTFEGIAGWYVARHFDVPLFVSLRGEVETKVFRHKPEFRRFLRRVSRDAARLYFVSAWFRTEFHRHVAAQPDKERLLPNIVRNITPTIVSQPAGDAFVSVLNLDTWKRKGLRWLLDAVALAVERNPGLRLDIIGGGSAENVARVAAMIAARALQSVVTLVGPVPNTEVLRRLPTYRGLLLPSLNETFGMVYVEALFAGIPVLMTAGTAIDGYLDGLDIARTAPPRDVRAIAAAILDLSSRNAELRANIAAAAPLLFARFDPATTVRGYSADVRDAIAGFTTYE